MNLMNFEVGRFEDASEGRQVRKKSYRDRVHHQYSIRWTLKMFKGEHQV